MKIGDRERLIARIQQIRRPAATRHRSTADAGEPPTDQLRALEARVADLEQMVEGLQDSVHRESERHGKLIAELQAQTQPASLGAALARDARTRGL